MFKKLIEDFIIEFDKGYANTIYDKLYLSQLKMR